jgi:hypothetical protein
MNDFDLRFTAQSRRHRFRMESGMKNMPIREMIQTFAGLTMMDA